MPEREKINEGHGKRKATPPGKERKKRRKEKEENEG